VKQPIKTMLGQLVFGSRLNGMLLGETGVVVAFHRVNAGADASGLSMDPDTFERYCCFFRRHFRVISLRTFVDRLERREPVRGLLAITFDDGYRDNFERATPILEQYGLPATFFVVSQWMGSSVVPAWDSDYGVRHAWMTWDDVRSLRRRGFDIGAHTRTHVDLGLVNGASAREEIEGGRRELEAALGEPVDLFTYPFGGARHMTDSNRALVKAAGFRCCCSCYGGVAPRDTDPFHLRRMVVSPWYRSPQQFGLDVVREANPLSH
jgi:peptidoglycan/xylan/chitin deacetylase (PgdA/CDA1 family)